MINFDVSQSAALRISELLKNEPDSKIAIRVAVDSGGCSGFMYDYNLIDKVNDDDFVLEKYGVKIAIDPLSQQFLEKMQIRIY